MGAWGSGARPSRRLKVVNPHSPKTEARGSERVSAATFGAPGGSPAKEVGLKAGEAKIMGGQHLPIFWGLQTQSGHPGSGSEVSGLRRSLPSHHLLIVPRSLAQSL